MIGIATLVRRVGIGCVLAAMTASLFAAAAAAKAPAPPGSSKPIDRYASMAYRFVGPPGNRVSAVVGVPGDRNTYYVGAASGGVWKSTDGGTHWKPVFDEQPAQSIGSIAIAPSDPNVVWVGTGEPFIRSNVSLGNGIYKSTDAGKTWTHMGLEKTGRIARVLIDPNNINIVFAAAIGTGYGPQPERGVYPDDRRRKDLGARFSSSTRTPASPTSRWTPINPANSLCRSLADRHQDLGKKERRARKRSLRVPRRRHDLEALHGHGPARAAARARSRWRSPPPIRSGSTP